MLFFKFVLLLSELTWCAKIPHSIRHSRVLRVDCNEFNSDNARVTRYDPLSTTSTEDNGAVLSSRTEMDGPPATEDRFAEITGATKNPGQRPRSSSHDSTKSTKLEAIPEDVEDDKADVVEIDRTNREHAIALQDWRSNMARTDSYQDNEEVFRPYGVRPASEYPSRHVSIADPSLSCTCCFTGIFSRFTEIGRLARIQDKLFHAVDDNDEEAFRAWLHRVENVELVLFMDSFLAEVLDRNISVTDYCVILDRPELLQVIVEYVESAPEHSRVFTEHAPELMRRVALRKHLGCLKVLQEYLPHMPDGIFHTLARIFYSEEVVKYLLERLPESYWVFANGKGCLPIHTAVLYDNVPVFRLLYLARRPSIFVANNEQKSAMQLVFEFGRQEMFDVLNTHPNSETPEEQHPRTLGHDAHWVTNRVDPQTGATPLHWAVLKENGHGLLEQLVSTHGLSGLLLERDHAGQNVLHYVLRSRNTVAFLVLLTRVAPRIITALMLATDNAGADALEYCLVHHMEQLLPALFEYLPRDAPAGHRRLLGLARRLGADRQYGVLNALLEHCGALMQQRSLIPLRVFATASQRSELLTAMVDLELARLYEHWEEAVELNG